MSVCVFFFILFLYFYLQVNEVQGYAAMQLIFDAFWYDPRFNMTSFWELNPAGQSYSGYDITAVLTNQSLNMWKPQITFLDAASFDTSSESMKMFDPTTNFVDFLAPNPQFSFNFNYEAVFQVSLVQPGFDFASYPNDQQQILIRYTVMNYDAEQLQVFPLAYFCSQLSDGSCAFSNNPVWTWDSEKTICNVYYDAKGWLVYPTYAEVYITLDRQGNGVIIRLIMPITVLLLLSGLTFWISYDGRVDTTITLMLSVSALYIVILQNIPMVGYLTTIDKYVFAVKMFSFHFMTNS